MGVRPERSASPPADAPTVVGSGVQKAVLTARDTLETVLEAVGCAAFVVDRSGRMLLANAIGKEALAREGPVLTAALARTVAGDLSGRIWELMPLSGSERSLGFLALLRPSAPAADATAVITATTTFPKTTGAILRAARLWKLTRRQNDVLELVACGLTNGLVAEMLEITARAVEYHVSAILDKAGAANRTMLIAKLLDL
jgi:DNA-binding NarL/FixJ family response regulator